MGDFNRSGINWVTMKSDWRGKSLLELSQDLFLTQHVKDNTREDALLDLIFSSEPGIIDNLDVREKFGEGFETYSDHIITIYDMILRTEMKTVQKCTYNYINADVLGMKSYMMRIKWKEELQRQPSSIQSYIHSIKTLRKCGVHFKVF